MPARQTLAEARPTLVAEATGTPGRYRVQLISPGHGSSGYYSAEVLAEAARLRVFPAGLHMYADHPTATEAVDRPERSVRDLWGVLASDATVDGAGALVAEAQVFAPFRPLVDEMREAIGLSIRAYGTGEDGEAEGRRTQIITSLDEGLSVDFVTAAGRGGRILELLESARHDLREGRNVGHWIESRLHLALTQLGDDMFGDGRLTRDERITLSGAVGEALTAFAARVESDAPQLYQRDLYDTPPDAQASMSEAELVAEATANDTREALGTAVADAYADQDVYAWVRDYDPDTTTVYFDISGDTDDRGTYQQTYQLAADGTASLTGQRTEVSVRTTYVPVSPAGSTTTQESTEDSMANITIDEAEHGRLVAEAGRVTALETERDTEKARADKAEQLVAERDRRDAARPVIAEAFSGSPLKAPKIARLTETLLADLAAKDDGSLDVDKVKDAATKVRTDEEADLATHLAEHGIGSVTGLGGDGTTVAVSEADLDAELDRIFTTGA